ncbi:MAG: glycosyltransferase family 4 protein [Candidatus Latescibacteria bacterium]|nr:glycosyltransferase family 4 protein [Candidatus Latescibacterota bacterium]
MRILIVSTAYWPYPSGVSEVIYYLSNELNARGHKVTVLTTNYSKIYDDGHNADFDVVRVGKAVEIHINQSVSHISLGYDIPVKIKRLLKNEHFDIIHYHNCFPLELESWVLHYSKTINCVSFHTIGFKRNPLFDIGAFIFKKYINKIHGHIAISEIARNWNRPYFPGDYTIIPNGVDTERFSLSVEPFEKPKNAFVILYLGRLHQRKGIFVALDAFKNIKDKYPNTLLYVVGKGLLENEAQAYTEKLGLNNCCRFFGYVSRDELPRFYRTCDVFISPALGGEAQGIVLLEAMASGKAVIVSAIPGYQEVVADNENGLLFQTGSSQDLAEKIRLVMNDNLLRQKLEINARGRAEQYAWPKIVERVENYYTELIAHHKSSF